MPQPPVLKKLKLKRSTRPQDFLELTPKIEVLFSIGDGNAKLGIQEVPRATDRPGLGVQSEGGQT